MKKQAGIWLWTFVATIATAARADAQTGGLIVTDSGSTACRGVPDCSVPEPRASAGTVLPAGRRRPLRARHGYPAGCWIHGCPAPGQAAGGTNQKRAWRALPRRLVHLGITHRLELGRWGEGLYELHRPSDGRRRLRSHLSAERSDAEGNWPSANRVTEGWSYVR